MDTGRGLRCRVGWHRWQVVAEEHMEVRVCDDCGRRRFNGPLPGAEKVPPAGWGMNYTGGGGFGGDGG